MRRTSFSPTVEEVSYPTGHIATAAWTCVEWQFEDTPDRVTTSVDGMQVSTFANSNVAYDWHPTRQFDIYYDDLAFDSKRVGCPAN